MTKSIGILKKLEELASTNIKGSFLGVPLSSVNFIQSGTYFIGLCWKSKEKRIKEEIERFWVGILEEIIYNVEPVKNFRNIKKDKLKEEIIETMGIKKIIKNFSGDAGKENESDKELKKLIYQQVALLCGIAPHNVESYLRAGKDLWTDGVLRGIVYGIILQYLFIKIFPMFSFEKKISYYIFSEEISSDSPKYFDGALYVKGRSSLPYYHSTKFLNIGYSADEIINRAGLFFEKRVKARNQIKGALIFIPFFPNEESMKAEIYWRQEKKIGVKPLYLSHFWDILRMWNKDKKDKIEDFLMKEVLL